jgi:hypothetical protein
MAMRRALALVAAVILIGGAQPVWAISTPVINAATAGVELCEQAVCGAAIFAGFLRGQVGSNPNAVGLFAVAVTHDPLPEAGDPPADITGGVFQFQIGLRQIKGVVVPHVSTLTNNGDNTFTVHAVLMITAGGSGIVNYTGRLNHNVFPPTVIGTLSQ